MRRGRIAKATIVELNERIAFSKKKKKELSLYFKNLNQKYLNKEISYSRYIELTHKKIQNKTIKEWIDYYDHYIQNCENLIKQQKKSLAKNRIQTFIFIFLFTSLLFTAAYYIDSRLTGFIIEGELSEAPEEPTPEPIPEPEITPEIPEDIQPEIEGVPPETEEDSTPSQEEEPLTEEEFIEENITTKEGPEPKENITEPPEPETNETIPEPEINVTEEETPTNITTQENITEDIPPGEDPSTNITTQENITKPETNITPPKPKPTPTPKTPITNITPKLNITSPQINFTEVPNASVQTTQFQAVLGQPVKWTKKITLNESKPIKVKLPKDAKNITVKKLTKIYSEDTKKEVPSEEDSTPSQEEPLSSEPSISGITEETASQDQEQKIQELQKQVEALQKELEQIKKQLNQTQTQIIEKEDITPKSLITGAAIGTGKTEITGNFIVRFFKRVFGALTGQAIVTEIQQNTTEVIINDTATEFEIEYETPAPTSTEKNILRGKQVKISSPPNVHYTNVLAFTNLPESLNLKDASKIKIYWIENDSYVPITNISDTDSNGIYDYIEWVAPQLSNQTFNIIIITKAEHLDNNKNFISDIYEEVKAQDNIWSETIPDQDYVRVTFERNLTSSNDITIYPRTISGNPSIEVYEFNQSTLIAEFTNLIDNQYNKVILTNLQSASQDVFDLRVTGGSVEIDHIIDPVESQFPNSANCVSVCGGGSCVSKGDWPSPGNAAADDGTNAGTTGKFKNSAGTPSERLKCQNFGFSAVTGTVNDIIVEVQGYDLNNGGCNDFDARLLDATGTEVGSDQSRGTGVHWPTGGDANWNYTWTSADHGLSATDVQDVDFGFYLDVEADANVFCQPTIDFIRIWVDYTSTSDTEYPIFFTPTNDPVNNSAYVSGANYEFNISINSTNSTTGLDFNNVNYSASNVTATVFNVTSISNLAAGTYSYYWWSYGNGTSNNFNNSLTYEYTIAKATPEVNQTLNYSQSNITITQGDTIDLNCSTVTGDSGARLAMYQEGTLINNGTSPIGNTTTFNTIQEENITCFYEGSQNFTGGSDNWFVNVTAAPTPQIVEVLNDSMTDVSAGLNAGPARTDVIINFSTYLSSGVDQINHSTASINFTTATEVRTSHTCTKYANDTFYANYTCNVSMYWFDSAGLWSITAFIQDNNTNAAQNTSRNFSVGQTTGFELGPSPLTWPGIIPGSENQTSNNDPILLNNTGNKEITANNTQINATNLLGEANSAFGIYAGNISAGYKTGSNAECGAANSNVLSPGLYVNITTANLTVGNYTVNDGNTGQEQLYICINLVGSELPNQAYSSANEGAWTIRILLVAISYRRKKKTKKKHKPAIGLSIPVTIFSSKLGALESIIKYLKENMNMKYTEIAELLNRNERTIWTSYKRAIMKQPAQIEIKDTRIFIPISIFENRKLTILEAIIVYLKEQGLKYNEISKLLNRDQRNIRDTYSRAVKK